MNSRLSLAFSVKTTNVMVLQHYVHDYEGGSSFLKMSAESRHETDIIHSHFLVTNAIQRNEGLDESFNEASFQWTSS